MYASRSLEMNRRDLAMMQLYISWLISKKNDENKNSPSSQCNFLFYAESVFQESGVDSTHENIDAIARVALKNKI